jgi:hypothetical protein
MGMTGCGDRGDKKYDELKKAHSAYLDATGTFLDEAANAKSSNDCLFAYMSLVTDSASYFMAKDEAKKKFPELNDAETMRLVLLEFEEKENKVNAKIPAAREVLLKYWKREKVDGLFTRQ